MRAMVIVMAVTIHQAIAIVNSIINAAAVALAKPMTIGLVMTMVAKLPAAMTIIALMTTAMTSGYLGRFYSKVVVITYFGG